MRKMFPEHALIIHTIHLPVLMVAEIESPPAPNPAVRGCQKEPVSEQGNQHLASPSPVGGFQGEHALVRGQLCPV